MAAAQAARIESKLRTYGAASAWRPHEHKDVVRGYLTMHVTPITAAHAARVLNKPALKSPRRAFGLGDEGASRSPSSFLDGELESERRLEKLMSGGQKALYEATQEVGTTWDRALVKEWNDPPAALPSRLVDIKKELLTLRAKHNRASKFV